MQSNGVPWWKERYTAITRARYWVLGETMFVLLPLVVLALIYWYRGQLVRVFYLPEWSIAAVIFFGLTILKLVKCVRVKEVQLPKVNVAVVVLFCLSLVSILWMVFISIAAEPDNVLASGQAVLFVLALVALFIPGVAAEAISLDPEFAKLVKQEIEAAKRKSGRGTE